MSTIDQRIVEMTFKGETFVAQIKTSITALQGLKASLSSLGGSASDINKVEEAGKRFSLKGMSSGIDNMLSKFKNLGIVGVTAIATIANKAVNAGLTLLKSFTIDPIKAGLASYETKINAIQTILANTASEGTNLKQVTDALAQLNAYSNLTVYNFADMARNIGTFTAAGVGLKVSVASIKGIANLAALSGSSAQQASTGMYQLSQAIAAGVVKLQDWNSVVNAGFGGKVFQNALIQTARVNGVAVDSMIAKYGSFRQSLQGGWLSAKVLTETLSEFTGDLTLSQLKAMGFTAAESAAIEKQAAIAVKSATQIRTVSQLMAALKDDVSTAWASVWEGIIGNFKTAPKLLTGLFNAMSNGLIGPIYKLAAFLKEFDKLGGHAAVVQSLVNVFHFLGTILDVVKSAFQDVFPPATVASVVSLAKRIEDFTSKLKLSGSAAKDLKTIFTGVFSIFKIVVDVLSAVGRGLGIVFGSVTSNGGGFLSLAAKVASFITRLKDAIESSKIFVKFFTAVGSSISTNISFISTIIGFLGGLGGAFKKLETIVGPFVQKFGAEFSKFADAIMAGIRSGNFSAIVDTINHGLFGVLILAARKFIGNLGSKDVLGGGFLDTIKESFEGLTNALKTMQDELKSKILENIAISVALLSAALIALSLANPKKMAIAVAAITVMIGQLLAALTIVGKFGIGAGIAKMVAIAIALNAVATSMVILSAAVVILAHLSWSELLRGLAGIGILLAELSVTMLVMSADAKGLVRSSAAMVIMGIALNLLAFAVERLGKLPIETLAKGVITIAVLLATLAGFNAIGGAQTIATAAALVILGVALNIIAKAVAALGALSIGTLAKGLISMAIVLAILSSAMLSMEASLPGAVALVIAAAALEILGKVLKNMGAESWGEIAKAMVLLFGALLLISAGMVAMEVALPGAAALVVVAAALTLLEPVLVAFSELSWGGILKSLVALAGVFVIVGLAGVLLTPLIPTLIGLGIAIGLLGTGILAAGAGVFLFATGLGALAVAVAASGAAIFSFVKSILSLIPTTLKEIGLGIVAFATAIGDGASAIFDAFKKILSALLEAVIKIAPLAEKAFEVVMTALMEAINKYTQPIANTFSKMIINLLNDGAKYNPQFSAAGAKFLITLLNGIKSKIQSVIDAGTSVIVAFINGIGGQINQVVNAGINMVIKLINGIADKINASSPQLNSAAINLASAIISGIVSGVGQGISAVINAVVNMAESALNAAKHALGINSPSREFQKVGASIGEGVVLGVSNSIGDVNRSMETVASNMLSTLGKSLAKAGNIVESNMNLQPVITPVLDLSQAKKGVSALNVITKGHLISPVASTSSASSISAMSAQAAVAAAQAVSSQTNLTFNQTNTSPVALSAADIYRKTNNQLSIAKGELRK